MTATQMSITQMQRFVRICEDQGIRVTRTKKGLLIRFPDGSSTVQHFTNSDSRAMANQISRFRRAGMVHPNDTRRQKETLPAYITQGTISQKTRQRIVELVEQLGYPDAILSSTVVKETGMDPGWANRALYHSGFRPGPAKNKRVGRPWYTPEEILELKDKPKAHEVAETPMSQEDSDETSAVDDAIAQILTDAESEHEDAIETEGPLQEVLLHDGTVDPSIVDEIRAQGFDVVEVEDVSRETVPDPEPVEPAVEFIDERDSWAVDMEPLLGLHLNRMVRDRLEVLRAVGMDYEFRVWRKN